MDALIQPQPPEYGPGRLHSKAASGYGGITVRLLGSVEIEGMTRECHGSMQFALCAPMERANNFSLGT